MRVWQIDFVCALWRLLKNGWGRVSQSDGLGGHIVLEIDVVKVATVEGCVTFLLKFIFLDFVVYTL